MYYEPATLTCLFTVSELFLLEPALLNGERERDLSISVFLTPLGAEKQS